VENWASSRGRDEKGEDGRGAQRSLITKGFGQARERMILLRTMASIPKGEEKEENRETQSRKKDHVMQAPEDQDDGLKMCG